MCPPSGYIIVFCNNQMTDIMKQTLYRIIAALPGLFLSVGTLAQQAATADSTDALNKILVQQTKNEERFSSELRPLNQIAGAPQAFYSYFWEMGDGSYSTEKEPAHSYKKKGNYNVYLWATNNYDDGKRPPIRYKTIWVSEQQNEPTATAIKDDGLPEQALTMRHNADPKPDETFVCVTGYKITGSAIPPGVEKGTLVVCYNETHFRNNNFVLEQVRTHNEETEITEAMFSSRLSQSMPQLLAAAAKTKPGPQQDNNTAFDQVMAGQQLRELVKETMKQYRDKKIWQTTSTGNNVNNIFLQLHTTPEMIRDTNATVKITTIFIPDNSNLNAEITELEMQIVASHDPNRMKVKRNILNYRFVSKRRKMQYTIQFQNTGKGPASRIELQTAVPRYLNTATLNVHSRYPRCPDCSTVPQGKSCFSWRTTPDSIYFIFNNIYLPGTQQKGVNDLDSTKGFVSYELNFNKHIAKRSFTSQTAIIFDKNPPVVTNKARNVYQPGISPGIIAGYYTHNTAWNQAAADKDQKRWEGKQQWVLGVSIAPFAPHRPYLQAEAYIRHQAAVTETGTTLPASGFIESAGKRYELKDQTRSITYKSTTADVAGLLKYNLNDWVSLGTGAMLSTRVQQNTTINTRYSLLGVSQQVDSASNLDTAGSAVLSPAFVLDIGLGRVRVGPSLGFRYLQYFQAPASRFFLYATWKL